MKTVELMMEINRMKISHLVTNMRFNDLVGYTAISQLVVSYFSFDIIIHPRRLFQQILKQVVHLMHPKQLYHDSNYSIFEMSCTPLVMQYMEMNTCLNIVGNKYPYTTLSSICHHIHTFNVHTILKTTQLYAF